MRDVRIRVWDFWLVMQKDCYEMWQSFLSFEAPGPEMVNPAS